MSNRNTKTKLELTWIGKENRPKLELGILLGDPEKSYHAPHRVTDHDHFDNRLIFVNNLLALKRSNKNSPERSSASLLIRRTTQEAPSPITTMGLNIPSGFR